MRIVTWNCYRGDISQRLRRLEELELRPDLVALQECREPHPRPPNVLWTGPWPEQGVALVDCSGRALDPIQVSCDPPTMIATRVDAGRPFVCANVWAHREPNYEAHIDQALDSLRGLGEDLVVLGDFNSTPTIRGTAKRHERLVSRLQDEFGLVSAYHQRHGQRYGEETKATLWRGKANPKGFHIDYCFIPKAWVPQLREVQVGTFEDWPDSDHRPVVADLDI